MYKSFCLLVTLCIVPLVLCRVHDIPVIGAGVVGDINTLLTNAAIDLSAICSNWDTTRVIGHSNEKEKNMYLPGGSTKVGCVLAAYPEVIFLFFRNSVQIKSSDTLKTDMTRINQMYDNGWQIPKVYLPSAEGVIVARIKNGPPATPAEEWETKGFIMQNIPSTLLGPIKLSEKMYTTLETLFKAPDDTNLNVWKDAVISLKDLLKSLKCDSSITDLQLMVQTSADSSASGKGTVWLIDPASYYANGRSKMLGTDGWIKPTVEACHAKWDAETTFDSYAISCDAFFLQTNSKDIRHKLKQKKEKYVTVFGKRK